MAPRAIARVRARAGDIANPFGRSPIAVTRHTSNLSLERELTSWQIFMILISGIIGVTIFATTGQILRTAGPSGLMTAIAFVGINAICVMEGLGEMVVLWPVSNAMMAYVRKFVDRDLAIVVGIAYWYSWASVIATMFVVAANFMSFWHFPTFWSTTAFYLLGPVVIIAINWMGVKYFGWIEGLLGGLKLFFVLMGACFLFAIGSRYGSKHINEGYKHDLTVARDDSSATVLVIPYLTYGFLGVEMVSVTAFEAKEPRKSLRQSARWIAWVITALFILCGIGECLNVAWDDAHLLQLGIAATSRKAPALQSRADKVSEESFSVLVLAAEAAGLPRWANFLNACLVLVISCLSAANTALYIASRTLYGLCKHFKDNDPSVVRRFAAKLGSIDPRTSVPNFALFVSVAAFFWLPFLHLREGYSVNSLLEITATLGSVGCVLVWASQCLAFIRYHRWLRVHREDLADLIKNDPERYQKYDRRYPDRKKRYYSILAMLQPFPAYLGLVMCLATVFVFSTATWWKLPITPRKFFVAYAGPLACFILWIALKAWRYQEDGWTAVRSVDLRRNGREFAQIIDHFEDLLYLRDPLETNPGPREGDSDEVQLGEREAVRNGDDGVLRPA